MVYRKEIKQLVKDYLEWFKFDLTSYFLDNEIKKLLKSEKRDLRACKTEAELLALIKERWYENENI